MLCEAIYQGSIYSRNADMFLDIDLEEPTVVLLIPKLFTPICSQELKELNSQYGQLRDMGVQVVGGSTDSPEVADVYFSEHQIHFPFIHVTHKQPILGRFIDEDGYCTRSTIIISSNKLIMAQTVDFSIQRDIERILKDVKWTFGE